MKYVLCFTKFYVTDDAMDTSDPKNVSLVTTQMCVMFCVDICRQSETTVVCAGCRERCFPGHKQCTREDPCSICAAARLEESKGMETGMTKKAKPNRKPNVVVLRTPAKTVLTML